MAFRVTLLFFAAAVVTHGLVTDARGGGRIRSSVVAERSNSWLLAKADPNAALNAAAEKSDDEDAANPLRVGDVLKPPVGADSSASISEEEAEEEGPSRGDVRDAREGTISNAAGRSDAGSSDEDANGDALKPPVEVDSSVSMSEEEEAAAAVPSREDVRKVREGSKPAPLDTAVQQIQALMNRLRADAVMVEEGSTGGEPLRPRVEDVLKSMVRPVDSSYMYLDSMFEEEDSTSARPSASMSYLDYIEEEEEEEEDSSAGPSREDKARDGSLGPASAPPLNDAQQIKALTSRLRADAVMKDAVVKPPLTPRVSDVLKLLVRPPLDQSAVTVVQKGFGAAALRPPRGDVLRSMRPLDQSAATMVQKGSGAMEPRPRGGGDVLKSTRPLDQSAATMAKKGSGAMEPRPRGGDVLKSTRPLDQSGNVVEKGSGAEPRPSRDVFKSMRPNVERPSAAALVEESRSGPLRTRGKKDILQSMREPVERRNAVLVEEASKGPPRTRQEDILKKMRQPAEKRPAVIVGGSSGEPLRPRVSDVMKSMRDQRIVD